MPRRDSPSRRDLLRLAGAGGLALGPGSGFLELLGRGAGDFQELRHRLRADSTFTYVCAADDTHACRMRAYVRDGAVTRVAPVDDPGPFSDAEGGKLASWGPRTCARGLAFPRRLHGPYRLRHPWIREGWKRWADDGFPELTPDARKKYLFDARGSDTPVKLTWAEGFDYAAKGFLAVAKAYSGPAGAARLAAQGALPETVEAAGGAGTRTIKAAGAPGELGAIGQLAVRRFCTTLALLDAKLRGVAPDQARGGSPLEGRAGAGGHGGGHDFVTGVHAPDGDLDDLVHGRLHVLVGANLLESRVPDAHWLLQARERGAKIHAISPHYDAGAARADCWIPVRPGTEAALFLGIARHLLDAGRIDAEFLRRWTDFPLLIRTDSRRRLRAEEAFPGYRAPDLAGGPSVTRQGLTQDLRRRIGDFVAWDAAKGRAVAVTRDQVGAGSPPDLALEGAFEVNGIPCMTLGSLLKVHLKDYDLDSVVSMTKAPRELLERLAADFASTTPATIHLGEGPNQHFHSTLIGRAAWLPLLLTGNVGKPGSGCRSWGGGGRAGLFPATPWSGPGAGAWTGEDPFQPALDPATDGKDVPVRDCASPESTAFWVHGDRPLVVDTPKAGRKCLTGRSHLPTPTRALWISGQDLLGEQPWAYQALRHQLPAVDFLLASDWQAGVSSEHADLVLPTHSWAEQRGTDLALSPNNPFVQVWKGGLPPIHDTRDLADIAGGIAARLAEHAGEPRIAAHWKLVLDGRTDLHLQRVIDASASLRGYRLADLVAGKHGAPGTAPAMFRTRPRVPFHEQHAGSRPHWTDTGRLNAYCDLPEAIEAGENFPVHREGVEATPHQPNVIVSTNPHVLPADLGIPENDADTARRSARNVKKGWKGARFTKNPTWEDGHSVYCLSTPTRHRAGTRWGEADWSLALSSTFADPHRPDRRSPAGGEAELRVNPALARDLGLRDGDYAYVDASAVDRPYEGMKTTDPHYRQVARCKVRVRHDPSLPTQVVLLAGGWPMATERSAASRKSREDRRAYSEATGYQALFASGGAGSLQRAWLPPMRMLDSLVHKAAGAERLVVGADPGGYGPEAATGEVLVRLSKAEDGGLDGNGPWSPSTIGLAPGTEHRAMQRYLGGEFVRKE